MTSGKILTILFCLVTSALCCQQKINVLFVGNSLTYTNNLPELVRKVASHDSVELNYRSLCFPNYALVDHWNDRTVINEINSGNYNFVIVQQGPSSQAEGRTYLINYGLKIDSLCKKNRCRMAVYTVWPAKARSFDFEGVIKSHKMLADSARAILCPAGSAWLNVWETNPEIKLYGQDNFHPGYNGTLVAALVIYGSIRKKNNLGFVPYEAVQNPNLTRAEFNALLKAVQLTLKENRQQKK